MFPRRSEGSKLISVLRKLFLPIPTTVLVLSLAVLVIAGFWPRPLAPMALTYRAPLFVTEDRGERIELTTLTQLQPEVDQSIPKSVAVWIPGQSKNLTIVASGLVGDSQGSLNLYLAQNSVAANHSTLILPSPTHWAFALRRLPKENRSSYEASVHSLCHAYREITHSSQFVKKFHESGPEKILLVGLSLGARHAISMADCLSEENKTISIFAVNPPTDLKYAGETIDRLADRFRENRTRAYTVGILMAALQPLARFIELDTVLRPLTLFPEALADLAAGSFSARMERITSEQETLFDGVSNRRNDFSFRGFSESGPATSADFAKEVQAVDRRLEGRMRLIHSKDDFLIRAEDLLPLAGVLKERARIFDSGGHGGLVFEPVFDETYRELMN